MRHDTTTTTEADPADAYEQQRAAAPEPEDVTPVPAWEADPADVADQYREEPQEDDAHEPG